MEVIHEKKKRLKEEVQCNDCNLSLKCNDKLREHMISHHPEKGQSVSPCNSPPRKRLQKEIDEAVESFGLEEIDISISREVDIRLSLDKTIKELELLVEILLDEQKKDDQERASLNQQIDKLKNDASVPKAQNEIYSVRQSHISLTKGFKYVYRVKGNGACLENSAAVHLYGDENKGEKVKRMLNDHIVENYDYYELKLFLSV